MLSDLLVFVAVWCSVAFWFVGAFCRLLPSNPVAVRVYGLVWLMGAILICVHIAASYGFIHHWSHSAALQTTADESERVTGLRAGWGVYVNFAFAITWLGYSVLLTIRQRRIATVDLIVFWFTAIIVFSATVVFEAGVIRVVAVTFFAALTIAAAYLAHGRRL